MAESDRLTYDNLKLGEKRKEMFLAGKPMDEINRECAFYLNSRPVIYGLNVTDLGVASVLARLALLLPGRPGCGKSQFASDISNYFFGGTGKDGLALEIDGTNKELNIYDDNFSYLDRKTASRKLSDNIHRCFFDLEEISRQSGFTQNQFINLATGKIVSPKGEETSIGKYGYSSVVATANIGDGEYKGTFEVDKALKNRFGVVIDFDYEMFKPTSEDLRFIRKLSEANPNVKKSPVRDISGKIISASKEISEKTLNIGIEAEAVMDFLTFGLNITAEEMEAKFRKALKMFPGPESARIVEKTAMENISAL